MKTLTLGVSAIIALIAAGSYWFLKRFGSQDVASSGGLPGVVSVGANGLTIPTTGGNSGVDPTALYRSKVNNVNPSYPPLVATASVGGFALSGAMITCDQSTWPTGDKVWDVCRAIAHAEGADSCGSNPDRLNNPGDISDYASVYGSEYHSGSDITTFPDKETGWRYLYNKVNNIRLNQSSSYKPSWTWEQIARTYAGNWKNWMGNVTEYLGVDTSETFASYFS